MDGMVIPGNSEVYIIAAIVSFLITAASKVVDIIIKQRAASVSERQADADTWRNDLSTIAGFRDGLTDHVDKLYHNIDLLTNDIEMWQKKYLESARELVKMQVDIEKTVVQLKGLLVKYENVLKETERIQSRVDEISHNNEDIINELSKIQNALDAIVADAEQQKRVVSDIIDHVRGGNGSADGTV